ncbi:MAG: DUF5069 domain-containing protein [Nitrospiraceae bacterium]|jgi:hypothetical protein|nr:DUF5069 domain-containing protein [Nitrospiraceae bacterium]
MLPYLPSDDPGHKEVLQKLRSPRERLGGYAILPRLIDKVRLRAAGLLPPEYRSNLLRLPDPGKGFFPLDGRFLEFTGLDPAELEQAILSAQSDEAVLAWVAAHSKPHSSLEREEWSLSFDKIPPDEKRTEHRRKTYPSLAHRQDIGTLSPFDLIDIDEGRQLP